MKVTEYHWEIKPMEESEPYHVYTKRDSVLDAVKQFTDAWGDNVSIYSVRKAAVTERYVDEEFGEVS